MDLKVKAPAKIILFGEWAVMSGQVGIAAAVDLFFELTWKSPSTERDDPTYLIRSVEGMALWDPAKAINEQKQIPEFFKYCIHAIQKVLFRPGAPEHFKRGGEFLFAREWPLQHGLGSSSAIVACLCEWAFPNGSLVEKWEFAKKFIQLMQSPNASALDVAAQLKGGTVYLKNHEPRGLVLPWPEELSFLHGEQKADTADWISNKNPNPDSIKQMGRSAEDFLEKRDWMRAIEEHSLAQENMDIWPENLRKLRSEWLSTAKVSGMKSCGAGGGDCWMIWNDPKNFDALQNEAKERGFVLHKYKLASHGVLSQ